ncbi:hypothetical protein LTR66_012209 [Elasticomyces elasticus]|nr:hypothetical protein LTR66_012209 [Elasticomyces elasticus]
MHHPTQLQFRDPFALSYHPLSRPAYAPPSSEHFQQPQVLGGRDLPTPPPEMYGVVANSYLMHPEERGVPAHKEYPVQRSKVYNGSYDRELSNAAIQRWEHSVSNDTPSRPRSPPQQAVQPLNTETSHQRKISQHSAIAASLQIPRSINNSQGSLSELAAQITCLFWFESYPTLQLAEDPRSPLLHTPLVSDALPTTGFRKWVTTILSTTQVAQNVILLALLFIYRLKKLNPNVRGKPGSEYRLLTVALMLGNKFLDDNTYTNKTWAEVSGISVAEVHIMEVEFLSNMRYSLFTSAAEWTRWHAQLARFASFFDRASRPLPPPLAVLPLSLTPPLHLSPALPSPPASTQASPPYPASQSPSHVAFPAFGTFQQHTPITPSPLGQLPELEPKHARKRSNEDYTQEPPAKRVAQHMNYASHGFVTNDGLVRPMQSAPRLTLPSLSIPPSQTFYTPTSQTSMPMQLPPLNVPPRSISMVYPSAASYAQQSALPAVPAPVSQLHSQMHSNVPSRQQSPYPGSAAGSPTSAILPYSSMQLHPSSQLSPSYFLAQRNSPYRPVRGVSTLLVPPPSASVQEAPQNVNLDQMHYQPLGRPANERRTGPLPYVTQDQWYGPQSATSTPIHQWPAYLHSQQQPVPQPQYG